MRRVVLLAVVGMGLAIPAQAGAAVTIGETFAVNQAVGGTCLDERTIYQAGSPAGQYAAPASGVITAWSHHAAVDDPSGPPSAEPVESLKLKVARTIGSGQVRIVGSSPAESTTPGALNTFRNVRIPVRAGDFLGAYLLDDGHCLRQPAPGYTWFEEPGDPSLGTTVALSSSSAYQLDLSAKLEPDRDNDGYGDESQDKCTSEAGPELGCDPPETTITKHPKNKTTKRKAKFKFGSDETGSTFECSLDGAPFESCAPPFKDKVKRRKHTFAVRAIDTAGSTDPTPATDEWKVKKPKR
jgi:hypothetical protein